MIVRLRVAAAIAALALVAAAVACSADDELTSASGSSDAGAGDAGSPAVNPDGGAIVIPSTGLVIVHAAAFPAFRLCFSNFPDRLPFPDRSVMPESNVVGVEVGSVVRLDPLAAPGDVYVIDERLVQASAGSKSDKKCSELVCAGSGCLRENLDYIHAGTLSDPVGQSHVDVLAITGCGNGLFLNDVDASSSSCGAGWTDLQGNLKARILPLVATARDMGSPSLPVQLVHMSQLVEADREGGALEVTYGAFDGGTAPLEHAVAEDPTIYQPGAQVTLPLPLDDDAIFASQGFRIALRTNDADGGDAGASASANAKLLVDTSLAEVQLLSAPREVPSSYYRAASSYALLLLGDPNSPPVLSDGGANPAYDPRRGMHLLAIPVAAPEADAGAEGGATTGDGG